MDHQANTQPAENATHVGRFAPSPTGRMHLGNIFTAVISWLSARKAGGKWILRIEDLDPQRSKMEYARLIEDDLLWLGLTWDEGGTDNKGPHGPYLQSMRGDIYASAMEKLKATGLTYPCLCTRADIMATQAPHQSDGRIIYQGTCRPSHMPSRPQDSLPPSRPHATRLYVPDEDIPFSDTIYGGCTTNLAKHCGDFVLQRADKAWAYQLAVVVDDAMMGITEVVRGNDLLLSTAQQLYLYRLLGLKAPAYAHLPLICNRQGQRLSKRDESASMHEIRKTHTPEQVLGHIAHLAGLIPDNTPCTLSGLIPLFSWDAIPHKTHITI